MAGIIAFLALVYGLPTLIAVMIVHNYAQRLNALFAWRISRISAGVAIYVILASLSGFILLILGDVLLGGFLSIVLEAQAMLIPVAIALSVGAGMIAVFSILWNPASDFVSPQTPRTALDYLTIVLGIGAVAFAGLMIFQAIAPSVMPAIATSFKDPALCTWIPEDSMDQAWGDGALAHCLQHSQSARDFYEHCDLFPQGMRDAGGVNMSPYTSCIFGKVDQDKDPDACLNISAADLRGQCAFPYQGTAAWQEVCTRAPAEGWLGNPTLIIDRCLTSSDVNSPVQGSPVWFDPSILGKAEWGTRNVGQTRDDTLAWLKSIGASPNLRDTDGNTIIMALVRTNVQNGNGGPPLTRDDARALIAFGVDPNLKNSEGLRAVDMAYRYGALSTLTFLTSIDKQFVPSTDDQEFFLDATCHDGNSLFKRPDPCDNLNSDLQSTYEAARQAYIKQGWLPILNTPAKIL